MAAPEYIIPFRTKGTRKAAADIRKIGKSASSVRKTLALMRNALVIVAAFRVFGRLATGLAEFSRAMATVGAVTRSTADELKQLRARARELGATTRFTATEVAEGIVELGRAGFSTNEILSSIAESLNLAQVGMISLSKATTIVAGTLRGFELNAAETERVVDILTETSLTSLNTILDLGEAMKLVAPIAHGLNIEIEELAAVFGVLGENNIRASMAGTSVRRILTDLAAPTGGLAKILDALNIGFEEVSPSIVGFRGALERLSKANVGTTLAAIAFGKRGANAYAILIRAIQKLDKDGVDSLTRFEKKLLDIQGVTEETARIMDDNLEGAFKRLISAANDLRIALGDAGAESLLRDLVEALAVGIRVLADNINRLIQGVAILTGGFALSKLAKVMGRIILVFRRFIGLLTSAGGILTLLRFGVAGFVSALILGSAALVAFGSDLKVLEGSASTVGDVFDTLLDILGDTLVSTLNTLGFEFKNVTEVLVKGANEIAKAFLVMADIIASVAFAAPRLFDRFIISLKSISFFAQKAGNDLGQFLLDAGIIDSFNDTSDAVNRLGIDIIDMRADMLAAGSVFDLLTEGSNRFRAALDKVTKAREAAERSASNRARRIFKPTIIPRKQDPLSTGLTLEDVFGPEEKEKERQKALDALIKLESRLSPLRNLIEGIAEAQDMLNEAKRIGVMLNIGEVETLKRVQRELLGFGMNADQAKEQIEALTRVQKSGAISLDEYRTAVLGVKIALLEARTDAAAGFERFLLKQKLDAEDAATQIEDLLTNAFEGAQDALHDFVTTGKLDFSSLIDSIISDLTRLAIKMATNAIFESVFGAGIGAAGGITGQTNTVQDFFNFLTGAGGGVTAGTATNIAQFPSFAHQGSFSVSRRNSLATLPGVDNRLIAFRANDNEEVHVTKKSDAGRADGGITNITLNVVGAGDADSFLRSSSQIQNKLMFGVQTAMRRR